MLSNLFHGLRHRGSCLRALGAALVAGLLVAGCGGDGGDGAPAAASNTSAAQGDGSAAQEQPIVAPPTSGPCAASGTQVLPSPSLNSKLDCAP